MRKSVGLRLMSVLMNRGDYCALHIHTGQSLSWLVFLQSLPAYLFDSESGLGFCCMHMSLDLLSLACGLSHSYIALLRSRVDTVTADRSV